MTHALRDQGEAGDAGVLEPAEHLVGDTVGDDPCEELVGGHEERSVEGAQRCDAFGVPRPRRDHGEVEVTAHRHAGDDLVPVGDVGAACPPDRLDPQSPAGEVVDLSGELFDLVGGGYAGLVVGSETQGDRLGRRLAPSTGRWTPWPIDDVAAPLAVNRTAAIIKDSERGVARSDLLVCVRSWAAACWSTGRRRLDRRSRPALRA